MQTTATGGILTWSPAEWAVFLGIFATGLGGILAVVYQWWAKFAATQTEMKKAIQTNTENAIDAKVAAEVAKALATSTAERQQQATAAIRRDLTVTQLATATTMTPQVLSALSAAVEQSPTTTTAETQPATEKTLKEIKAAVEKPYEYPNPPRTETTL